MQAEGGRRGGGGGSRPCGALQFGACGVSGWGWPGHCQNRGAELRGEGDGVLNQEQLSVLIEDAIRGILCSRSEQLFSEGDTALMSQDLILAP